MCSEGAAGSEGVCRFAWVAIYRFDLIPANASKAQALLQWFFEFFLSFYWVTLHWQERFLIFSALLFSSGVWSVGLKKFTSINMSLADFFSFGNILFPSCTSSEMHLHFNSAICCPFHGPAFGVFLRVADVFPFFPIP